MIKSQAASLLISLSIVLVPRLAIADAGEDVPLILRYDLKGGFVEVAGLNKIELELLKKPRSTDEWNTLFSVHVVGEPGAKTTYMVGKYEIIKNTARFVPRYPFEPGILYEFEFFPDVLGPEASRFERGLTPLIARFEQPKSRPKLATRVENIFPSSNVAPENLLKLYVYFSAPMSRGEAYRHITLLDANNKPVERPFLELGEELWNPEMTRLTLLFDPGRIKRGLKPREEEGPILESGKTYTLRIAPEWPDANGNLLDAAGGKTLHATEPDSTQPSPARWRFEFDENGALIINFDEPLDRAMLEHAIRIEVGGRVINGKVVVAKGETWWKFTSDKPWPAGEIFLLVNPELEDLAGNSIARAFEVDNVNPQPAPNSRKTIRVPVPKK